MTRNGRSRIGRRGFGAGGLALAASAACGPAWARAAGPTDLNLVLAVDVSRSIDDDEAQLQREGYVTALTDPAVLAAIEGGMLGAIGLVYVEWAGFEHRRTVVPWSRIDGVEAAQMFASQVAEAPRLALPWTSVSGAILHALDELQAAPFEATRSVIDISGDGDNNSGPPVAFARDEALAQGVVINGLPIVNDRPTFGRRPPMPIDRYYTQQVIGGPGAFIEIADDFRSFREAVRRKLVREIADLRRGDVA